MSKNRSRNIVYESNILNTTTMIIFEIISDKYVDNGRRSKFFFQTEMTQNINRKYETM